MKSCRSETNRTGGYTLLEILIAMGILVSMGGGLVSLLSHCVSVWGTAEKRGRTYETARALLDRIAEDLRSIVIRSHAADADPWVRLLADEGPGGRQRLRLVRAIPGETADTILREGGRLLGVRTPAAYDGRDDASEAAAGLLQAPGGLMEVLYMLDPRPGEHTVWRGVRAPIGGPDSLFIDRNIEEGREIRRPALGNGEKGEKGRKAPGPKAKTAAPPGAGSSASPVPGAKDQPPAAESIHLRDEGFYLREVAAPISDEILHLGFRFWAPTTNTWEPVPALRDPKPGARSGPSDLWDSTRAILDVPADRDELAWKRVPGSEEDATDDIFPERVEVTLVVREEGALLGPRLAEPLGEKEMTILLTADIQLPEDARDRHVAIDGEWIAIDAAEGRRLTVAADGRGARFSVPGKHEQGSAVETGVTFRRVVEIPGFRTGVKEIEEAPRRRRAHRP